MDVFVRDIQLAFRSLRRNPVFALVALLTLALGIGATTTVFSVVYGVLLRPLPFPNAQRFVQIVQPLSSAYVEEIRAGITPNQFVNLQESATTLEAVGSWLHAPRTLTGLTTPVRLHGGGMTAGLFQGLGVQPLLGRGLRQADSERGAEPIVVLSYRSWRAYFGGRSDIIDTRITLDSVPTRVVGVMPEHFTYPSLAGPEMTRNSVGELEDAPEFWIAVRPFEREQATSDGFTTIQAFAILKPGVSMPQAEAEIRGLLGPMPKGWTSRVELVNPRAELGQPVNRPLVIFQLGVILVLLIACVNVVNLLLARASGRRRELAIRTALGASRGRLLREGVAEVLLVSCSGGAGGCAIAYGLTASLRFLPPHVLPRLRDVHVDGVVLTFALGVSVISGVAIGLLSAWRASRSTGIDDLHQHALRVATHSAPARLRPSNLLVVAEIAAAVVLLTSAGLLVRSFVKLISVDMGYQARGLATLKVGLPAARYPTTDVRSGFSDRFAGAIRALPGVVSVAGADESLSGSAIGFYPLFVDGRDVGKAELRNRGISPDYFRTLGVPIVEGREFRREDRTPTPSRTVVNEAFARRYLAGRSAIGRQIRYSDWDLQIVGVVANVRNVREGEIEPTIYLPATYSGFRDVHEAVVFVRTTEDPAAVLAGARPLLARLDPQLAVYDSASVEEMLEYSSASPRLYGLVSFTCAVVALMLAIIGLYGVLAYSVGSRTQEFGIRMALGAESRSVMWHVMRQGLLLTAVGLAAGLGGSYAAARGLSTLLFGITPADVPTFATTAVLLTGTAVLACLIPSRRATRVDPVIALRSE